MSSSAIAPSGLLGVQQARISSFPPYASTSGGEAIELGRLAGIELDPWQQVELRHEMGEAADWKCPLCTYRVGEQIPCPRHQSAGLLHPHAAFECVDVDPRQNGKSEKLIVRMLAGLFIIEEPLQIFSAHLFDTAMEIFRRLEFVIVNCDDLRKEVRHRGGRMVGIRRGNGDQGIELTGNRRVRFKARTAGGGRGFSCDTLYLDEAMILPEQFLGATVPTMSARANPQLWLAGSAPDEEDPAHDGVVLARRRARALAGDDPSLAYFEHSAEGDDPARVPAEILDDPRQWALANPGLGIRITEEYIANERRAMGTRQFAVERLGIGAWPDISEDAGHKIPRAAWDACLDRASKRGDHVCFAFDVSPDRSQAAIAVASIRPDGRVHGEIIDPVHPEGTDWVVPRLKELAKHRPQAILWDSLSQANSLKGDLENEKVRKRTPANTRDLVSACGEFYDAVIEGRFAHIGQPQLAAAVDGAAERKLMDAWAWARRNSSVDITPLVAVTLAVWAAVGKARKKVGVVDLAAALAAAEQQETAG